MAYFSGELASDQVLGFEGLELNEQVVCLVACGCSA